METERLLVNRFLRTHPAEAARILEQHLAEEVLAITEDTPPDLLAAVFSRMAGGLGSRCLALMEASRASDVLGSMPSSAAAAVLRRMEAGPWQPVLDAMPEASRQRLRRLLRYPEETVGALMDPSPRTLAADATVAEGTRLLGGAGRLPGGEVYVVDRNQKLIGVLSSEALATASDGEGIEALSVPAPGALSPHAALTMAVTHSAWSATDELPVVDLDGVLVGALPHRRLRAWAGGARTEEGADALRTALGLGELMWLGLYGLVEAMASTMSTPPPDGEEK